MSLNRSRNSNNTRVRSVDWVINPSGDVAIASGDALELRVTLINQGHQGAIFDVYLDETAVPVRHWCREPFQRLALDSQQSAEVVFRFEVPLQTLPDDYEYLLVLDAPEHYPEETPLQHQSRFRIVPPVQSSEQTKDPTFQVLPETTPERPALLRPGQPLELQAIVRNRSDRVDRFRLTCSDLPESWYRIIYPAGLQDLGQALPQDSLLLNPGAEGRILMLLQLPKDIIAGRHLPTLRLHSANNPDLVLIDVTYLQVEPTFALLLSLQSMVDRVQTGAGRYQLTVANGSNTQRSLHLAAQETAEAPICAYTLEVKDLVLAPGSSQTVDLAVQPTRRWQRPWWGKGRTIPFYVEAQDAFDLPVDRDRVTGDLLWEPRPLWQRLLALALIIGGVAGLGLLVWWLFFRPPARLQIAQFAAESEQYEAARDDFIHLQWQVGPPNAIRTVELSGKALTGDRDPVPVTYDFADGIPPELADICTRSRRWLTCRFVQTDARLPGDYQFELTVLPKRQGQAIATQETDPITIRPLPDPQIARFTSQLMDWKPQQARGNPDLAQVGQRNPLAAFSWLFEGAAPPPLTQLPDQLLVLNWQIAHPQQLQTLELITHPADNRRDGTSLSWSFAEGLPEALAPFCQLTVQQLTCQRFPAAVQPGEYGFELAATYGTTSEDPVGTVVTAETDVLALVPPAQPEVLALSTDRFSYPAADDVSIRLSWTVSHLEQLQTLRLIGRSPEGRVGVPPLQFTFNGRIPEPLSELCEATPQGQLTCRNVPITVDQPGQYRFELAAIPRGTPSQPTTAATSELIEIEQTAAETPPPQVAFFRIDGQNAPPKYTAALDTQSTTREIRLSWKVTGTDLQVELLPSPGTVPSDAVLTYQLGPGEKTETLTLRVTDGEGRQVQRSVVIATTVAAPPDGSSPSAAPGNLVPALPSVPARPRPASSSSHRGDRPTRVLTLSD